MAVIVRNSEVEIGRLDAILDLAHLIAFPEQELSDLFEDATAAGEALSSAETADDLRSASDAHAMFLKTLAR